MNKLTWAQYKHYSDLNYYNLEDLKFLWPYIKHDLNDPAIGRDLSRKLDRADVDDLNQRIRYHRGLGLIKLSLSKHL